MALNINSINNRIPSEHGLNYRVTNNFIDESAPSQIYCVKQSVTTSDTPVDIIDQSYYFGSIGEAMQMSSSSDSDTMMMAVYYYVDINAEEPSIEIVTLNGRTPVTLNNNIYRISRIVCANALNQGTVYLYKSGSSVSNGVPSENILCCVKSNIGFSQQSYLYIPKGWTAYLISMNISGTQSTDNSHNIKAYRLFANGLKYEVQNLNLYRDMIYEEHLAPGITENSTYILNIKKSNILSSSTCTILYNFILLR